VSDTKSMDVHYVRYSACINGFCAFASWDNETHNVMVYTCRECHDVLCGLIASDCVHGVLDPSVIFLRADKISF